MYYRVERRFFANLVVDGLEVDDVVAGGHLSEGTIHPTLGILGFKRFFPSVHYIIHNKNIFLSINIFPSISIYLCIYIAEGHLDEGNVHPPLIVIWRNGNGIHLSINYPSIHLSIYLPTYPSVYLSIITLKVTALIIWSSSSSTYTPNSETKRNEAIFHWNLYIPR